MPFTLAACAEMLWRDRPIEWRASRLDEMGFQVGLWNWPDHDLDKLEKSGATFSIMNGYLRGRLTDDEGAAELLKTARETAQVGKRLGVARLNLHGTGLGEGGLPVTPVEVVTGAMWLKAGDTLAPHLRPGRRGGRGLHAGKPQPAGRPSRRALRPRRGHAGAGPAIDHPRLRLNLDLYHAQIGEGNLIDALPPGAALDRRDPGRRRARPLRAGHRRDQLCRRSRARSMPWAIAARSAWRHWPRATRRRRWRPSARRLRCRREDAAHTGASDGQAERQLSPQRRFVPHGKDKPPHPTLRADLPMGEVEPPTAPASPLTATARGFSHGVHRVGGTNGRGLTRRLRRTGRATGSPRKRRLGAARKGQAPSPGASRRPLPMGEVMSPPAAPASP